MNNIIALAGNPNCGKTTLFNQLTKSNQHVGNWPGVTVEQKMGSYWKNKEVKIVDLPGIYSLSPMSIDEIVARNFLLNEKVDVVLDVIDATNLERNLYLTTHLLSLDCKIVIALNMIDEAKKKGIVIDKDKLSKQFGCPVIEISAMKGEGLDQLMDTVINVEEIKHKHLDFDIDTEKTIAEIEETFVDILPKKNINWYSVKLLEMDRKLIETLNLPEDRLNQIKEINTEYSEVYGDRADIVLATQRYDIINLIVKDVMTVQKQKESTSDKIDKVLTHKIWGIPIFIGIMFVMFFVSIQSLGAWTVEGMEWLVAQFQNWIFTLLNGNVADWLTSLVVDGIISGVGSIIVFVPQIMILFGFISVLEACGYMARVAFILDRTFNLIGLSGKSLIPMIVGCGCSVPGIMGARTIKNKDERNATIMLVPFMPCSAKLVIFTYFTTVLFGGNALVATSLYFIAILAVIFGGLFLKFIRKWKKNKDDDTFVLELPPYRVPQIKNVLREMWERGKAFLIKAGTVIFLASIVLWLLQNFTIGFKMTSDATQSILASIGKCIDWLFVPLGFGRWEYAVATFTGIAAKETVIVTLELLNAPMMNVYQAYAFMVFNLLCFPCVSAIAAGWKELGGGKLGMLSVVFQFCTAYIVTAVIYQASRLLQTYPTIFWTVIALIVIVAIAAVSIVKVVKDKKNKVCVGCPNNGYCHGCDKKD